MLWWQGPRGDEGQHDTIGLICMDSQGNLAAGEF
jgi:isoaspartyl peptidase/L-asparaginase-like protein (Ntn-hydrolase superfamily)